MCTWYDTPQTSLSTQTFNGEFKEMEEVRV